MLSVVENDTILEEYTISLEKCNHLLPMLSSLKNIVILSSVVTWETGFI
jgi:hypothetical protein